jgi:hypothetical protein
MRRPWIRGKNFHNFHCTKRISVRRGHEKLAGEELWGGLLLGLFFLEKEGEG